MIVVADASPVIGLERIGRLGMLPALYERVIVPSAVFQELLAGSAGFQNQRPKWLEVRDVEEMAAIDYLGPSLDPGETEANRPRTSLGVDLDHR